MVKKLLKTINGQFEALSIICSKRNRKCYLRLSERLDPQLVVENINSKMFANVKLHAFVPESVPDVSIWSILNLYDEWKYKYTNISNYIGKLKYKLILNGYYHLPSSSFCRSIFTSIAELSVILLLSRFCVVQSRFTIRLACIVCLLVYIMHRVITLCIT